MHATWKKQKLGVVRIDFSCPLFLASALPLFANLVLADKHRAISAMP
jgi:hypothetical protein